MTPDRKVRADRFTELAGVVFTVNNPGLGDDSGLHFPAAEIESGKPLDSMADQLADALREAVATLPKEESLLNAAREKAESLEHGGRKRPQRQRNEVIEAARERGRKILRETIEEKLAAILGEFFTGDEKVEEFSSDLSKFFASFFQGELDIQARAEELAGELAGVDDQQIQLLRQFWGIRRGFASGDQRIIEASRNALEMFKVQHTEEIPEEGILVRLIAHISNLYPDRTGIKYPLPPKRRRRRGRR
jgi:hypothetical protein